MGTLPHSTRQFLSAELEGLASLSQMTFSAASETASSTAPTAVMILPITPPVRTRPLTSTVYPTLQPIPALWPCSSAVHTLEQIRSPILTTPTAARLVQPVLSSSTKSVRAHGFFQVRTICLKKQARETLPASK